MTTRRPRIFKPRHPVLDRSHPLARGLVVAWVMGEGHGVTVRDLSGFGHHATLPADLWVTTRVGPALSLYDNTVTVNASQDLLDLPVTYNWTAVLFHNPSQAAINTPLLTWGGNDRLAIQPNSSVLGSGGAKLFWEDIGGTIISEDGPDYTGQWKSVAIGSWAFNDHRWYRDGRLIQSSSASGTSAGFTNVQIGNLFGTSAYYRGQSTSILIYDRALLEAEIKMLSDDPFAPVRPRSRLIVPANVSWDITEPTETIPDVSVPAPARISKLQRLQGIRSIRFG